MDRLHLLSRERERPEDEGEEGGGRQALNATRRGALGEAPEENGSGSRRLGKSAGARRGVCTEEDMVLKRVEELEEVRRREREREEERERERERERKAKEDTAQARARERDWEELVGCEAVGKLSPGPGDGA